MRKKYDIYKWLLNTIASIETDTVEYFKQQLVKAVDNELKPKRMPLSRYAVYDTAGNVEKIKCSISGIEMPATTHFFNEVKSGGIRVGDIRLSTQSKQALEIRRKHKILKRNRADKIINDMNNRVISVEEASRRLKENAESKPDYTKIKV